MTLDPLHLPGIILSYHAPFAWGTTVAKAVENAVIMEEVARLALQTEALNPERGDHPTGHPGQAFPAENTARTLITASATADYPKDNNGHHTHRPAAALQSPHLRL